MTETIIIESSSTRNTVEDDITKYIFNLSKEMNIDGAQGVLGNELELIALVRNCPFLYDKRQPDFKDVVKKSAAWNAIAAVLHASVRDVQQRWRSLRDGYNKYRKEIETDEDESLRYWEFYDDMKFIDPFIVHRRGPFKTTFDKLSGEEGVEETVKDEGSHNYLSEIQPHVLRLISVIKACPVLYHRKHPDARNKELKKLTWNQVAETLNVPVLDCMTKWKTLRERYGKERRQALYSSEDTLKWCYSDTLSFLDNHIKQRRSSVFKSLLPKLDSTNSKNIKMYSIVLPAVSQENRTFAKEELLEQDLDIQESQVEDGGEISTIEFVDSQSLSKCSSPSSSSMVLKPSSPSPSQIQLPDEDDLFGQTIAAELKLIPRGKKKMKLKADMYRLLYESHSDD